MRNKKKITTHSYLEACHRLPIFWSFKINFSRFKKKLRNYLNTNNKNGYKFLSFQFIWHPDMTIAVDWEVKHQTK